jgi:ectoine hydroxylase-related dioxygenase (phytanoyl-CoA dioxygenase family)
MPDHFPAPTPDIEQASADLERHGFCVLTDAIPTDLRARLKSRITEQAAGEAALSLRAENPDESAADSDDRVYLGGAGRRATDNARVWTLLNKGAEFQELLTHPDVLHLVGQILGTPFLLSAMQANFVSPGDAPLPLHSDQGYVPRPWPPYPLTASTIWMLDDFTEDNGATTVVPGTHLETAEDGPGAAVARARVIRKGGVPVCGPAGSALVFDGRIIHGTGINTTGSARLAVLTYFCAPFLRQQENHCLSLDPAVLRSLPDRVRELLGVRVWKTLGSVEGVCAEGEFVDRPAAPIGALDMKGRPLPAAK